MKDETARTLARLRSLLAKGKTLEQAGRRIGRTKSTAHRLAQRHGLRRERLKPRISNRSNEQIRRRLREAKLTLTRIAELSRVSITSVWRRSQQRLDAAGSFRPKGIRAPRRCPIHGLLMTWPCVACAALRARAGNEKAKLPSPQSPG